MTNQEIAGLRAKIDRIDRELLSSLGLRAELARKIGRHKQKSGLPVFDPAREALILDSLCRDNQGPLPDSSLKLIMKTIIFSCRSVQERARVSFLGPEGTFSHQAALECFGPEAEYEPLNSIKDVFRRVESGTDLFGLVPAENSTEGGVGQTMDLLTATGAKIRGEHLLPIRHALMAASKEPGSLKRIYSHPQALAQCREWLSRHVPGATLIETSSTAQAARRAAGESGSGAIGSSLLAGLNRLEILAEDIQDIKTNLTRFLILGQTDQPPTGRDRTSLLVRARHVPGSLHRCLQPISEAGLNLTRIESRPARGRPWEYVFFLDIQGHRSDEPVRRCLASLVSAAESVVVLGSYPRADHDPASGEGLPERRIPAATGTHGPNLAMEG